MEHKYEINKGLGIFAEIYLKML